MRMLLCAEVTPPTKARAAAWQDSRPIACTLQAGCLAGQLSYLFLQSPACVTLRHVGMILTHVCGLRLELKLLARCDVVSVLFKKVFKKFERGCTLRLKEH